MRARRLVSIILLGFLLIAVLSGCQPESKQKTLILATTTSLNDTGLLSYLLPKFTKETGIKVKPIAVGSGEALEMGARGDADIVLAHSPDKEKELVTTGKVEKRIPFMYNYFVIVGPANDPAKVATSDGAEEAFQRITASKQIFISRGDESGTHKKELKIWEAAGIKPSGAPYIKTGQGMGETLQVANEEKAYTLTDKATFISLKDRLDGLRILLTKKKSLKNTYSVIVLNAKKEQVNQAGARKFKDWLLSKKVLDKIASFGQEKYGEPLFVIIHKINS